MENKNIIIILVVIIVILAAAIGIMFFNQTTAKEQTKIKITSDKEQYEGGELAIQLTDLNKAPISKEILNVKITNGEGKAVVDDVVKTDSKGKAKLDLDLKKGKYKVNVTYGGNENYTGNSTTQKLTIKEEVVEAKSSSTSSSSSVYAYKSDGTPMYNQHEVNEYMSHKYGLCDYDIQPNGYIDLKHGTERGQYSTNWKDGIRENGLA